MAEVSGEARVYHYTLAGILTFTPDLGKPTCYSSLSPWAEGVFFSLPVPRKSRNPNTELLNLLVTHSGIIRPRGVDGRGQQSFSIPGQDSVLCLPASSLYICVR